MCWRTGPGYFLNNFLFAFLDGAAAPSRTDENLRPQTKSGLTKSAVRPPLSEKNGINVIDALMCAIVGNPFIPLPDAPMFCVACWKPAGSQCARDTKGGERSEASP